MARSKRTKWQLNKGLQHVLEPPVREMLERPFELRGCWNREVFATPRPITLELGCGRGDYTFELARRHPGRNFVGVDIKGHRFWHGARAVADAGLSNAAFLRARIELVEQYFAPGEVDQIWLTFSDPQPRDGKGTRRITSPYYLERYARILAGRGPVHVKSDSRLLYERTLSGAREAGHEVALSSEDLHADLAGPWQATVDPALRDELAILTHYERRWIAEGRAIFYLRLLLARPGPPAPGRRTG